MSDLTGPTPEAYEAALAKWHERAAAGVWTSPEEHVAALVDAAWPFAVAKGRRQAAQQILAEITRLKPQPVLPLDAELRGRVRALNDAQRVAARVAEGTTDA